jgi:hypothetical protein
MDANLSYKSRQYRLRPQPDTGKSPVQMTGSDIEPLLPECQRLASLRLKVAADQRNIAAGADYPA